MVQKRKTKVGSTKMELTKSNKVKPLGLKKRVTLQNLIKDELPVWVRNNTGDPARGVEPGVIPIQVGSGDNISVVKIPPGNDPICITDQVDPSALKSCRDLFLFINNGGLELLDPEDVESYYEENASRLQAMRSNVNRYVRGVRDSKKIIPDSMPKKVGRTIEIDNPKIDYICQKTASGALKESTAFERLLEISSVFTEADYAYIQSCGHHDSIKEWAKDQLKELAAQEIADLTHGDE